MHISRTSWKNEEDDVNILVIGSGGREHALFWKLSESPQTEQIYAIPGNPGMGGMIDIPVTDHAAILRFVREKEIGLVVVGPEVPLMNGLVDELEGAGISVFGPRANAAEIEGSKSFAKNLMKKYGIPTARYEVFTEAESARAYIRREGAPIVIKADGLAAGKGVIVAQTTEEALVGVHECFTDFGAAGSTVMVEEMLDGPECSLLALTDGTTVVPLATSQDHKRALDGDRGPNTGGMGVYSPVPILLPDELEQMVQIERQVVGQLRADGIIYQGCLYGGFMLTKDGPKVLEFNARFGDPETQVVLLAGAPDTPEIAAEFEGAFAELQAKRKSPVIWVQEMMPRAAVRQVLTHATLFACPSVYEPLGIVNLEAMACETAVVASAVGGIPEVVVDETTGLLVPYDPARAGDPEFVATFETDFAAKVNRLTRDTALAEKFGKAGCVIGLLEGGLTIVHAYLGVALAHGDTRHGQVHAHLRALAVEVGTQVLDDVLGDALGLAHAHDVLGGPAQLTLLLGEALACASAGGTFVVGGQLVAVELLDVATNGTDKLHGTSSLLSGWGCHPDPSPFPFLMSLVSFPGICFPSGEIPWRAN